MGAIIPAVRAIASGAPIVFRTALKTAGLSIGSKEAITILGQLGTRASALRIFDALADQATDAFKSIAREAQEFSSEFDQAMKQVQAISGDSSLDLGKLEEQILALSNSVPESAPSLLENFAKIQTSGISDAAEAMEILGVSTRLATASMSNTSEVSSALITVLQSFGSSAGSVAEISDKLFSIFQNGNVPMSELGDGLNSVADLAVEAGVSFNELGAVIASSGQNLKPAEAFGAVKSILKDVLAGPQKNADDLVKKMKKLGVEFSAAGLKAAGFKDFMEAVKTATGGNITELSKLFSNVQDVSQILKSTTGVGSEFSNQLVRITEKLDSAGEGYERLVNTSKNQLAIFQNNIKSLIKPLGDFLNGATNLALKGINSVFALFRDGAEKATDANEELLNLYRERDSDIDRYLNSIKRLTVEGFKPNRTELEEITRAQEALARLIPGLSTNWDDYATVLKNVALAEKAKTASGKQLLEFELLVAKDKKALAEAEIKILELEKAEAAEAETLRRQQLNAAKINFAEKLKFDAGIGGAPTRLGRDARSFEKNLTRESRELADELHRLTKEGKDVTEITEKIRKHIAEVFLDDDKILNGLAKTARKTALELSKANQLIEQQTQKIKALNEAKETDNSDTSTGSKIDTNLLLSDEEINKKRKEIDKSLKEGLNKFVESSLDKSRSGIEREISENAEAEIKKRESAIKELEEQNRARLAAQKTIDDEFSSEFDKERRRWNEHYDLLADNLEGDDERLQQVQEARLARLKEINEREAASRLEASQKQLEDTGRTNAGLLQFIGDLNSLKEQYAGVPDFIARVNEQLDAAHSELEENTGTIFEETKQGIEAVFEQFKNLGKGGTIDTAVIDKQFELIKDSLDKAKKSVENIVSLFKDLGKDKSLDGLLDTATAITKEFENLGFDVDDILQSLVNAGTLFSGIKNSFQSLKEGGVDFKSLFSFESLNTIGAGINLFKGVIGLFKKETLSFMERIQRKLQQSADSIALLEKKLSNAVGQRQITIIEQIIAEKNEQIAILEKGRQDLLDRRKNFEGRKIFKLGDREKFDELGQQIEALNEEIAGLNDQIRETTLGLTQDSIGDLIAGEFEKGKRSVEDFGDTFEEILRRGLINAFKQKILGQHIDSFLSSFEDKINSGFPERGDFTPRLTAQEISDLQEEFNGIIGTVENQWKALTDFIRINGGNVDDLFGTSPAAQGLSGAIKGITEQTAGLLEGQFRQVAINTRVMADFSEDIAITNAQIAQNTINNEVLPDILFELQRINSGQPALSQGSLASKGG